MIITFRCMNIHICGDRHAQLLNVKRVYLYDFSLTPPPSMFSIRLLLLLFLSAPVSLTAQDLLLTSVSDLPAARSALTSATNGDQIYLANGFGPGIQYASEIYRYDVAADNWSVLTATSQPKRYASAAVVGDFLYVFNGQISNTELNPGVERIDLTDGSITQVGENPQPARAAGVAVWNDKIYSFGGTIAPNQYASELYEYDPATDTWTLLSNLPFAAETKGEIIDGVLYVIGGFNGSVSDRIDAYDLATDSWTQVATMPFGVSAHATTVVGSRIYVIGDFNNLTLTAYYDTADNSFEVVNSNLVDRRHCAAATVGGSLYVMGGNTVSDINSAITSVQRGDFATATRQLPTVETFEVFPNPASDRVHFGHYFARVALYDTQGRLVLSNRGINSLKIDELQQGMYILHGQVDGKVYQGRFIRQ